jgi:hypothetical protein
MTMTNRRASTCNSGRSASSARPNSHGVTRWAQRSSIGFARGLSQLQAGHDQRLELLGLIEGTISTERELHKRFSDHWLGGEWFERHEDILAHFREHGIAV